MTTIVTRAGKGSPLTNAEVDANFTNLNTSKLELSGGTLTGFLTLHAAPTSSLHAASKGYVDGVIPTQTGNSGKFLTTNGTALSWGTVDLTPYLAKSGGTMTGAIAFAAGQTWPTFNQNTTGSAGSCTGNAATATALQTARTINGVGFNGSADITITAAATNVNTQLASLGVGTAASGTAGEIRATNNITAYYSDARLKTKIGDIESPLAKVRQIETMLYHANETAVALGYDASIVEVGVSAQSVEKVQPEAVAPAPIDDKYLTVRYERLVPLLIEAIKELDAAVAKLVD